jgi:hypothetical protein
VLEQVNCGKTDKKLRVQGTQACFKVLLQQLNAAVDARDSYGRTTVHWLVLTAIADFPSETKVKEKPKDPRLKLGLETAGVPPGDDEMPEPCQQMGREAKRNRVDCGIYSPLI